LSLSLFVSLSVVIAFFVSSKKNKTRGKKPVFLSFLFSL